MSARDTQREGLVKAMPEGPVDDDELTAVGAGEVDQAIVPQSPEGPG
jgi:hypothetical protein